MYATVTFWPGGRTGVARPRLYFAAPLFTPTELEWNLVFTKALEEYADVYLPQRDGLLLSEEIGKGLHPGVVANEIFRQDCNAIVGSDAVVAILHGASIDDGVAFEIGFAVALRKLCFGLCSDSRRASPYFQNPMWQGALTRSFLTDEDLLRCVAGISTGEGAVPSSSWCWDGRD